MRKIWTEISLSLQGVKKFIQIRNSTVNFFDNMEEKESKVKAIATDENNGTMKYIETADEKYKMTKERCYELVNGYMN
ncbi:hypothetical protein BCY92_10945 [Bacillus wiedmannii]|nr:hypothetical protein BCY92_10945 [Bacillus wiedmannii]